MNKNEVKQLLRKRGAGKIDGYLQLATRVKERQSDLSNLLQSWLHSLLYYRCLYPQEAFQERQILGISIFAASAPPLRQYLDDFFLKITPHLMHINHLSVIIGKGEKIEEVHTLHIDDLESAFEQESTEGGSFQRYSSFQKDMQMKAFLFDLINHLRPQQSHCKVEEGRTFKLRIGYRHESEGKESGQLIDGWVMRERPEVNAGIACSLKSPTLNLIYQMSK